MKIGMIIETNDPEQAWNAVRFANASLTRNHSVKIFLMGAGVEIHNLDSGKFDVNAQMTEFAKNGGAVFACGTCIKSRNQEATEICPISTMNDCIDIVEWADKMLTF